MSGFYTIDNDIIDTYGKAMGPYGIAVYNVIARHANKNGGAFPSYKLIEEKTGISRPKVNTTIKKLIELGLIEKENRYKPGGDKTSNQYMLVDSKKLPPVVNDVNYLVNDVNYPSSPQIPPVVNDVNCNNTNIEQDQLNKTNEGVDDLTETCQPPPPPTLSESDVDEFVKATTVTARALPPVPTPPFQPVLTDSPTGPPQARQFDPRQLDGGGLWPEGTGQTPYEVYREAFATIPSRYQIKHMNANVADLDKWRQVTQKCALKSFKTYDNVFDVYQNGFRKEVPSGTNEPGRANSANPPRPAQIERRALGKAAAISYKRACEIFGEELL